MDLNLSDEQISALAGQRAPMALAALDRHARIVWASDAFAALAGAEPNELTGQYLDQLLHPDDLELFRAVLDDTLIQAEPQRLHHRLRGDDTDRWVETHARYLPDEQLFVIATRVSEASAPRTGQDQGPDHEPTPPQPNGVIDLTTAETDAADGIEDGSTGDDDHAPAGGIDVLVVDDDPSITTMLQMTLELEGIDVRTAANGYDALDSALRRPPDVLVLDVMMPGLDGREVTRTLRSDPRTTTVPIIICSALSTDGDQWQAWTAGADSFVPKPFEPDQILAEILRLVAVRRAGRV